jgi:agarase
MHEREIGAKKGRFVPRNVEGVFAKIARTAGKPVFITEWSFIGEDAGLPCKRGCGHRLPTQRDRADAISLFLDVVNSRPYMIGSAFFMWTDDPAKGVSFADPEDCNYGLVNAEDEPYELVTDAFRKANRRK